MSQCHENWKGTCKAILPPLGVLSLNVLSVIFTIILKLFPLLTTIFELPNLGGNALSTASGGIPEFILTG